MSTKDSNNRNNNNKRGSAAADYGDQRPDESTTTTKRQRCNGGGTIVAAPPCKDPQQRPQQRKERIAELERRQKSSDERLALLDRRRREEERHRKGLEREIAALRKAEQQQQQRQQRDGPQTASSSSSSTSETATNQDELETLERLKKDIMDGVQSKKDSIAQVRAELPPMERRLEKIEARIAVAKERPAKEERLRRRRANNNPRINEFMRILNSGGVEFAVLLKDQFPDLIDSVDFFWAVLYEQVDGLTFLQKVYEILFDEVPPTVLNDKELLFSLCCSYPMFYTAIPPDWQLRSDSQILQAVIARDPDMVCDVPRAVQLDNPRLIGEALARTPLWHSAHGDYIKGCIATEMWRNRDVVLGWVKGGGELHYQIPLNLRDQEILKIAYGHMKPTEAQNYSIPPRLCFDKEFMLKAVEGNPSALNTVANHLRGDQDLALAALSGSQTFFVLRFNFNEFLPLGEQNAWRRSANFWAQMGDSIRQKLRMHDSFVELILGSIDLSQTKPSALAMLDHGGHETVLARKKLIAEFAGVPIGDELAKLRKARRNLARSGLFWCD